MLSRRLGSCRLSACTLLRSIRDRIGRLPATGSGRSLCTLAAGPVSTCGIERPLCTAAAGQVDIRIWPPPSIRGSEGRPSPPHSAVTAEQLGIVASGIVRGWRPSRKPEPSQVRGRRSSRREAARDRGESQDEVVGRVSNACEGNALARVRPRGEIAAGKIGSALLLAKVIMLP